MSGESLRNRLLEREVYEALVGLMNELAKRDLALTRVVIGVPRARSEPRPLGRVVGVPFLVEEL